MTKYHKQILNLKKDIEKKDKNIKAISKLQSRIHKNYNEVKFAKKEEEPSNLRK